MATVDGRTRISIDELINSTIISGSVNSSGHLILVTRGGAEIDGGLIGTQVSGKWSSLLTYKTGDIVGYSGQLWRALSLNSNKPPGMFTNYWQKIVGDSYDDWPETDPFFDGKNITTSGDWNFDTYTGSVSSVALSSVAGEVEGGLQSLKISSPASASQSVVQLSEAQVRGGETIEIEVRAKLQSAVASATLTGSVLQNTDTGDPNPGASGVTTVSPVESPHNLTASWATYKLTFTAVNAKPRARALIKVAAPAGSAAVFLISSVRIRKRSPISTNSVDAAYGIFDELDLPNANFNLDGSGNVGPFAWNAAGENANDTGWITQSTGIIAGDVPFDNTTIGYLRYRKVNKRVDLHFSKNSTAIVDRSTNTTGDFTNTEILGVGTIPAAYRPQYNQGGFGRAVNDTQIQLVVTTDGGVVWLGGFPRSYGVGTYEGHFSYFTA